MCRISEACKEGRLPSALLSLLSMQHARSAQLVLAPPRLLPAAGDALDLPENMKAHLLQQAFANNNSAAKREEPDSDEYDDTDDIVLPEEADMYELGGESYEGAGESKRRDGGSSGDDASRQFECRHCGKKYRWKSTLRRHENVECGGKAPAHQCPYCSYRAKQRGNLGVHIRKHHNNEWYLYATSKVRRNKKTSV
ncbi:Lola [Operophtera brumata]|uniref:Lola n=1 Tax=Operophtera brumata TaxID=104452 RepID=A0A0L7KZD3_OPEBR|nr:Lola [Operophtera brumata]